MVIQIIGAILLIIAAAEGASSAGAVAHFLGLSQKAMASTVFAVGIILFFLVFYGYFVIFEKLWNGQTPGKRLLGIRVVRDGGYPVELVGSIIRNLVRIVEQILGFYAVSVISMLLSPENKRLGDYAAGTIVVRDRGFEVRDPKDWLRPGAGEASSSDNRLIANLTTDELALVDKYVARKTSFDPRSAHDAASKIAAALRPKLDPEFAALPDDELLMKIATRQGAR